MEHLGVAAGLGHIPGIPQGIVHGAQALASHPSGLPDGGRDDAAPHVQLQALVLGRNLAACEVCSRQQVLCKSQHQSKDIWHDADFTRPAA